MTWIIQIWQYIMTMVDKKYKPIFIFLSIISALILVSAYLVFDYYKRGDSTTVTNDEILETVNKISENYVTQEHFRHLNKMVYEIDYKVDSALYKIDHSNEKIEKNIQNIIKTQIITDRLLHNMDTTVNFLKELQREREFERLNDNIYPLDTIILNDAYMSQKP